MAMVSIKFGKELCEILGINPDKVQKINLRVEVGKLLCADVTRLVADEEANAVVSCLEKYDIKLMEKEEKSYGRL